jgi:hypothetical protein
MDSPLPSFSRIKSTVRRVPATTGLPIMTFGFATIIGTHHSVSRRITLPDRLPATHEGERARSAAGGEQREPPDCWSALLGVNLELNARAALVSDLQSLSSRIGPHGERAQARECQKHCEIKPKFMSTYASASRSERFVVEPELSQVARERGDPTEYETGQVRLDPVLVSKIWAHDYDAQRLFDCRDVI